MKKGLTLGKIESNYMQFCITWYLGMYFNSLKMTLSIFFPEANSMIWLKSNIHVACRIIDKRCSRRLASATKNHDVNTWWNDIQNACILISINLKNFTILKLISWIWHSKPFSLHFDCIQTSLVKMMIVSN